jgi:DNA-binding NarL/FixJ family response regulator
LSGIERGYFQNLAPGSVSLLPAIGKPGVELKPDVVLLDLSMPDMTGVEAAQQMSAADPTIPLILLTVLEVGGIGVAAHHAGIQAVIPKSEAWSLIESIEHLTSRQI